MRSVKGSTFNMMHSEINEMQRKGNRTAAMAGFNTIKLQSAYRYQCYSPIYS